MNHLETHKLQSQGQFGHRSKQNTEATATIFVNSIRKNRDLSKGFDALSHSQIINNLSNYGICGVEKEFFINYLFDGKQLVNFLNLLSKPETVLCGVPQGCTFRFLLFSFEF